MDRTGPERGKVLVPRLRGSHGPLDDTLPGGGLEGVGVDPLVSAHHLLPSLRPSLRGKERAPRGKPLSRNSLRGILTAPPGGCVDRGVCLRARRATGPRGSRPLPGFPAPIIYPGRRRRTEVIGSERAHFGPPRPPAASPAGLGSRGDLDLRGFQPSRV